MADLALSLPAVFRAGGAGFVPSALPIGADALATSPLALPNVFDPVAFLADLEATGCSVIACRSVPRGGEPAGPPSYLIYPPKGRIFGSAYGAVMTKWADALSACPDHVERVVAHVFCKTWEAAHG